MIELIVKIPDENSQLATQLLKKLGAEIQEKEVVVKQKNIGKKIPSNKSKSDKVSPTYLFGKWKNLEIDAAKLRKDVWDRSHKFS